jgi:uncharacterized membrane protein YGL010W
MRTAEEWLTEYGVSHRNPTNKSLHWVCVPIIVWCALGLMWTAPFPDALRSAVPAANWASAAALAVVVYYAFLSPRLALGVLPAFILILWSIDEVQRNAPLPLWIICVVLFVLAWIGQFIGHAIEGRRPSFFKDLQFLLIGPLWLLADFYRRAGIRY